MHSNRFLSVQLLIMIATAGTLSGCLGPYDWEHPHPLEDQAVTVSNVSGRTITLADGRSFELAGISLDKLTPTQIKEFEDEVRDILKDPPWMRFGYHLMARDRTPDEPPAKIGLVPYKTANGRSIALLVSNIYPRHPRSDCCNFNFGFPVGPLVRHYQPIAFDLGLCLLMRGRAHAAFEEIPPNVKMAETPPVIELYKGMENLATYYKAKANDAEKANQGIYYTDQRALKIAVKQNNQREIKKLLDRGVGPVSDSEAAELMVRWAGYGWPEFVGILIDQGIDPNKPASSGHLPLVAAVDRGKIEVIKLLLKHGADPHLIETPRGQTAIGAARTRETKKPKENEAMLQLLTGLK
ncbi:MAG: ankyrin repeat domain-containing protein [bacterium]|nr:ankyrin repeat domain-containing protein [bacterium]